MKLILAMLNVYDVLFGLSYERGGEQARETSSGQWCEMLWE